MVGREEQYICIQALVIHTRFPGLKVVAWRSAGKGKKRGVRSSGQPRLRLKEGTASHRTGLDDCRLDDFEWSGTHQRRDLSNLFQYERHAVEAEDQTLFQGLVRRGIRNFEASKLRSYTIRIYKAFSSVLARRRSITVRGPLRDPLTDTNPI
jgi:hypothetical protein